MKNIDTQIWEVQAYLMYVYEWQTQQNFVLMYVCMDF